MVGGLGATRMRVGTDGVRQSCAPADAVYFSEFAGLIEVASLLYHAGAADHVSAAGALYDAIEGRSAVGGPRRVSADGFGVRLRNSVRGRGLAH